MIEISISSIAWVSVVLIHIIVHLGIFGPRQRRCKEQSESFEQQDDIVTSAVKSLKCANRHDSSDAYLNVSAVTSIDSSSTIFPNASNVHDGDIDSDIDDDIVDMTPQICRTSTMSIDNMDEDPDERDTRDEDIVKQTVHENSNSSLTDTSISDHCVISSSTRDYIRSRPVKYEQTWRHSEEEKNDEYEYDDENQYEYYNSNYIHYLHQEDSNQRVRNSSSRFDPKNNSKLNDGKNGNHPLQQEEEIKNYLTHQEDDCDSSYESDPEEKWRYELIRHYHSSSPSMGKTSVYLLHVTSSILHSKP